jgi:hypothetical protein
MTVIELITSIRQHKKASLAILALALLLGKIASVPFGMHGVETFEGERNDILRRRNYLIGKLATTPQKVMKEMPGGMDADAGPIIANLSPSGTAFMVGSATCFGDVDVRRSLIKTAEIAGSTFYGFTENLYLLANFALVGEAVMLAMRTYVEWI